MNWIASVILMTNLSFGLWQEGAKTPINGLSNPYDLNEDDYQSQIHAGRLHSLHYPVTVTGLILPYTPVRKTLDADSSNLLRQFLYKAMKGVARIKSFDHMNEWLGLHTYPEDEGHGVYYVPRKIPLEVERMGFSMIHTNGTRGFTHSCTACHASNLFGRKIIGLTNRFPRANEYFIKGKTAFNFVNGIDFQLLTGATKAEMTLFHRTKQNLRFVEATKPQHIGLDTSLAHVALSLSLRAQDPYAEKNLINSYFPRKEKLREFIADSKPGVWWTVKYKNKWLLDGSVVSGNPILTNILWNEIGRGTDLHDLENWMETNTQTIEELTTAVFANQAPKMTDFFGETYFDLKKAELGRQVFEKAKCMDCHGTYKKAWQLGVTQWPEAFHTVEVAYPEDTLVKDVGTDPNRWQGMTSLEQLNNLAISQKTGVKVKTQKGYVPPPLEGIWARWPYFHNNSIPNLCALVTPPEFRPTIYYSGEAINPHRDFDFNCNGYPVGSQIPKEWITKEHRYDTRRVGMRNTGHYKMFLDANGNEKFSHEEKMALIHFLQTL